MQVVCAYDNDEIPRLPYEYDSKGRAAFVKDATDGSTIRTGYDQTDRPNETEQRDGEGNLKYRTLVEYDKKNRVKAFNEATAAQNFKTEYTYDADNRVTKVRYNGSDTSKVDYIYDKLNRITSRTVTNGTSSYATQFAYAPGATAYGENATTPLVSSITQGEGENAMNFAYTYDNRGNITSETRNGLTTTYVFDALGQLIRVNDPHENATWVYTYDCGGNILNKARYAYTAADELGEALESIPYTYGEANWKDKLTAYNGVPITYDAIGNPLNDGTWTYEWQAGRQLKSMTNVVTGVRMEFTYNHSGIRTKKVKKVNGVLTETTDYILNGKKIIDLTHTDHVSNEIDTMHFFYDTQRRIAQMKYNGVTYFYIHNLQGDIVGILDKSGNIVVEYNYNAWGELILVKGSLANTIGRRNPFMYRGYIWDSETDLYYLTNRYYTPVHSVFACADLTIDEKSPYAYCSNNPTMLGDWSGHSGEKSESSGTITDFMRDGFWAVVCHGNYHYNPKYYGGREKIDMIVMYIPYQDIQYYINAQYYHDFDPIEIVQESLLDETVSVVVEKATDVIDELYAGYGKRLSRLFSLIDVGKKFFEKLEEEETKNKQGAAHQKALNRKTGLIVVVTQTTVDRRLIGAFGWEPFGKTKDTDIEYYEATDYFNSRRWF